MPELPDVEHYRRYLERHAKGRRIEDVLVTDTGILRNVAPDPLASALTGHRFADPERQGKWLIAWTTGPAVLLHFGMTGDLVWGQDEDTRHRHDRVIFILDDGELRYRNMRKFGGLWLALDDAGVRSILASIGPDALLLGPQGVVELLSRRRGGIKAALMDQSLLAGVGNLVADEALWRAKIHPARRIEALSQEERLRLAGALAETLRAGIEEFEGGMRTEWMVVRGTPGARCPRCGTPLSRTTAVGRTSYFCRVCQPPG